MNYKNGRRKLAIELIGMAPFVWLGKLYGWLFPLKTPTTHFFFFPSADIGGGPRVNADITTCLKDKNPLIIFTKTPKNNGFLPFFQQLGVPILDLHKRIDNKAFHFVNFFYRGVLASWINQSPQAVVFGGECIFFYKVIPHLRKDIPRIELCHLSTWMPYTIGLIDHITMRIFSTARFKEDVLLQYRENGVPAHLFDRLHFIDNKVDIPPYRETHNSRLEIAFIGRGAPQKRVHLVAAIAGRMHELGLPAHVSFVGDVEKVIDPAAYPFCTFYGSINNDEALHRIYRESDVLILTSAFEGLPLVVMQMMAYGRVVVSTAVNGIPDYITHMENGLLIRSTEEDAIVEEGVKLLRLLIEQPALKATLGRRSLEIATQKFGHEVFCKEYRKALVRDI